MSLKNKTIVITGGGSGLGADAARAARAAGANVVLNGRSRDKLAAIANQIDPTGKHVAIVDGDIGKPETAERLISTAAEKFGGVDVLYNNAGIFGIKPLADVTRADLDDYFNLMAGYFTVTQLAVDEMRKRGGGSIVNIGSIWSIQGIAATPCSVPAMAKGGIHALSRSLAIELAPEKIRVNVIAPAVVETPSVRRSCVGRRDGQLQCLPSARPQRPGARHHRRFPIPRRRRSIRMDHRGDPARRRRGYCRPECLTVK